jgi:CRISPR/Cas system CSM-associated protein Csm2 small subunit/predicted  nucleic acid-binding Zn-ribbon protein
MMGSFQDAMKKAGIASDAEIAAAEPESSAASTESGAEGGERKPRPERPPRAERPPRSAEPEKVEDKPCAKCGTVFSPKHSKHRLCPKCAEEHFTASKEKEKTKAERPAEGGESKPAEAAPRPAAPRRDRPARPPRPAGEQREHRDAPRDSHRENRDSHRDTHRDSNRDSNREAPAGFPSDYLRSGYFSGTALRDEVLDRWAREVGALLVARGLAALQMRAFYAHVKRAEASSKAGREFQLVREELLKMRPVAAARLGRRLIPGEFADFLDRNLELVKDAASMRAFGEHFQAVAGFTAGRLRK